jgi:hypothetical protein
VEHLLAAYERVFPKREGSRLPVQNRGIDPKTVVPEDRFSGPKDPFPA